MSAQIYCKNILDSLINGEDGDEIMLDFATQSERNTYRTTLYQERKKFARVFPGLAARITINQVSDDTGLFLRLRREFETKRFSGRFAIKKHATGEVKVIDLNTIDQLTATAKEVAKTAPPALTEKQRITRVIGQMKEDGLIKAEFVLIPDESLADLLTSEQLSWETIERKKEEKPKAVSGEPTLCAMIAAMRAADALKPEYAASEDEEIAYKIVNEGLQFEELEK